MRRAHRQVIKGRVPLHATNSEHRLQQRRHLVKQLSSTLLKRFGVLGSLDRKSDLESIPLLTMLDVSIPHNPLSEGVTYRCFHCQLPVDVPFQDEVLP